MWREKIMGIQKSNLNNETMTKILKEKYNILPEEIIEINRGTANIFKIKTYKGNFILKEFNEKRTIESVEKEINIINFLKERDINVPKYIKTINDNFYIENEGRIIILQEFIDGYTMGNNTVKDYEKIIESAILLGKITRELKNYPELSEENIIEKQFSRKNLQNKIIKMKELKGELNSDNIYIEKIKQDLDFKIKVSEELEAKFEFSIIRKMSIINGHGDYSIQQLIYNDKNETTVIDFETAKKLPIVWEVMRSYSYIDRYAKDGKLNIKTLIDYFKEFSKFIDLNEYDLKYAPHIYLIQLIGSTFGYKEYNNDYSQKELLDFAFFRTNLCKYLYKNLDKISLTLSKELKC